MVCDAPATGPDAHPAPLGAEEPADVVVGRIARPFGRRGEVVVEPLTEDPRRFFDLAAAEVGPAGGDGVRRTLDSVRIHKGRPVVRFSGVTDISGAESLRASEVRIRPSERAPLSESRYYHDDLVGCRAESREGEPLGEIIAVEDTAGPSLLVLRTPRRLRRPRSLRRGALRCRGHRAGARRPRSARGTARTERSCGLTS